jgi:hypothetical protein
MNQQLIDYCRQDCETTLEVRKALQTPWYLRVWYRIRYGANWMMKR